MQFVSWLNRNLQYFNVIRKTLKVFKVTWGKSKRLGYWGMGASIEVFRSALLLSLVVTESRCLLMSAIGRKQKNIIDF